MTESLSKLEMDLTQERSKTRTPDKDCVEEEQTRDTTSLTKISNPI